MHLWSIFCNKQYVIILKLNFLNTLFSFVSRLTNLVIFTSAYSIAMPPRTKLDLKSDIWNLISALFTKELLCKAFQTEMVFCYQNCFDILLEKFVLVIEKTFWNFRLKVENLQNNLRSLEQSDIQTVLFLTCSWRFLRSNILEQLKMKL